MTHILTPGAKKRFQTALANLFTYVEQELDREAIMYWTAQLMPLVVSELHYETPKKETKKRTSSRRSLPLDSHGTRPSHDINVGKKE